jgi:hypothetical protein
MYQFFCGCSLIHGKFFHMMLVAIKVGIFEFHRVFFPFKFALVFFCLGCQSFLYMGTIEYDTHLYFEIS